MGVFCYTHNKPLSDTPMFILMRQLWESLEDGGLVARGTNQGVGGLEPSLTLTSREWRRAGD